MQRPPAWLPAVARLRRSLPVLLPIILFLLLGCLVFWPISPWDTHTLPVCNCADYAKMTAFLEWTPWAILHGHNPFFTTYQDYPTGVNMALNTTMPFLGVVLAPITLTAGPIAAMNVLARVALAGSAITAFLVFRRWVRWTPAAAAGGLLFGFSPYVMAHSVGHPNLIFVVVLPLLLLMIDEVVVRQRLSARAAGLLLGLVAAAQYGISSELLADAALLTVAALVLLSLAYRREVRAHTGHLLRSTGWALVAFVPLTGYPIVEGLVGARHLTGPVQPLGSLNPLRSDLFSAVLPTKVQFFTFGHLSFVASRFVARNIAENAAYIGLPLLLLVLGAAVAYRRDARLVAATVMVVLTYFISLGPTLNVYGHNTGIPLPYRIVDHIPLLDGAISIRFFAFGYLFLALGLALALDHLRGTAPRPAAPAPEDAEAEAAAPEEPEAQRRRGRTMRPLVAGVAGVAALVPLVPHLPLPALPPAPSAVFGSYPVPAYFTGSGEQAIPDGSPILVYPYSTSGYLNYSVLWQAVGGMRFRLTDGDATVPGPGGGGGSGSPELEPPLVEQLFTQAYFGPDPAGDLGNLDGPAISEIRAALVDYGFTTVIAAPVGRYPSAVLSAMTTVLGRAPVLSGGVYVWYGVQQDLAHEHATGPSGG